MAGHSLHKLDSSGIWLRMVNKISAVIIWAVALYLLLQLVKA
jgi:L-lysine exporter family protein LysE/ArgO